MDLLKLAIIANFVAIIVAVITAGIVAWENAASRKTGKGSNLLLTHL